ncbi:MAG: PEP-utilizing enzyme [Candidatus Helarchaeota archaeon]
MVEKLIGKGLSVSTKEEVKGEIKVINTVNDVIQLIQGVAEGKICLVEQSGTTTLGPILSRISAVVCTTGSAGSHLAIVSREFEIPAIMSLHLNVDFQSLDGKKAIVKTNEQGEGELYIIE